MVSAVRRGISMRQVAKQFKVSLSVLQYWVRRAGKTRLDRVDFSNHRCGPHRPANRTPEPMEDLILRVRQQLKEHSDLGEYGARAIADALRSHGIEASPTVCTIGRILERRGALDGTKRVRRRPPPKGWYLPEVAAGGTELDQFDVVSGLVIKQGSEVEVLTAISLHGGFSEAWPQCAITGAFVREALVSHWKQVGLPGYAQFDNDTRFQGPHQHPDVMGSVMRLCLSLGVIPVFAPVQETGFQAAIESFNGRWQAKVWTRFQHESLQALQGQSSRYIRAVQKWAVVRLESAPHRHSFPVNWQWKPNIRPHGKLLFLRRTSERGAATLLGHPFVVDALWPHRLVRAEVDLDEATIRFYALRRRDPAHQPLLNQVPYVLPLKRGENE